MYPGGTPTWGPGRPTSFCPASSPLSSYPPFASSTHSSRWALYLGYSYFILLFLALPFFTGYLPVTAYIALSCFSMLMFTLACLIFLYFFFCNCFILLKLALFFLIWYCLSIFHLALPCFSRALGYLASCYTLQYRYRAFPC